MRLKLKPLTKALVIFFVGIIFLSSGCSKKSEPETSHHGLGEQAAANWKFTLPPGGNFSS